MKFRDIFGVFMGLRPDPDLGPPPYLICNTEAFDPMDYGMKDGNVRRKDAQFRAKHSRNRAANYLTSCGNSVRTWTEPNQSTVIDGVEYTRNIYYLEY